MDRLCGNCFQQCQEDGICPFCGYDNTNENVVGNSLEQGFCLAEKYVIGRVLGVGGFGITYLAYDSVLSQIVAIKEYLPNEFSTRVPTQAKVTVYTGDKEEQFLAGQKRFVEEAKKLAKFQNCKEIVQIYDCFDENNTSYIVMEYLSGSTIQEVLKQKGRFEPYEAVEIGIKILHALEEVHKVGILHRDIAPDNIFMTEDGTVKLIDFGAARYATTSHSKSLSVIIKQGYAPIEQYRSRGDQGPWTDVYGVAATLYKMITNITPQDSMERAVKDTLVPPSKMGIKIDRSIENAILNALNVPIEGRPQSARAFCDELTAKTVKRNAVKCKKVDVGRIPLWTKVVGALMTAAVVLVMVMISQGKFDVTVAGFKDFTLQEGETRVPNIVNIDLVSAQREVEEQFLEFVIVNKEYSAQVPKDKVLIQSIHAGSVVPEGTTIEVTVSGGEPEEEEEKLAEDETCMPDIQYKSEDEAIALLGEAGLETDIQYEESENVQEGLVIRQDIAAGEILKKGTKITFFVSKKVQKKKETPKTQTSQETKQEAPQAPQQPVAPQPSSAPQPQPQTQPPADNNDGWQTDFDLDW